MPISTMKIPTSINSKQKWNPRDSFHKRVDGICDWDVLITFNGNHTSNTTTKSNGNPNEEVIDPVMVLLREEVSMC